MSKQSKNIQSDIDERSSLTNSNKFELLLFRLGASANGGRNELFGINVFKVREIVAMPTVTAVAGLGPHMLGVVNLRGQIIPVLDLPSITGFVPKTGLNILLVTEFARTTQAFAVESVEDIVRLEWGQVLSAESSVGSGLVTSIARLDGDVDNSRLAQVLDVETILRKMIPNDTADVDLQTIGPKITLKTGTVILAADDSVMARTLLETGFDAMGAPYVMTKSGKEAWEKLEFMSKAAEANGQTIYDRVSMVLTDLEMPEMDGFTLTRNIKKDPRFNKLPVVIHSSLTGTTNEAHVRDSGADAYVAKFEANELAATIRKMMLLVNR
jgi:two-component system chemotaxis response regulator CheV